MQLVRSTPDCTWGYVYSVYSFSPAPAPASASAPASPSAAASAVASGTFSWDWQQKMPVFSRQAWRMGVMTESTLAPRRAVCWLKSQCTNRMLWSGAALALRKSTVRAYSVRRIVSRGRRSTLLMRFSATTGLPYRILRSSKWDLVMRYSGSFCCSTMSGLGFSGLVSWVHTSGMDPRICTAELSDTAFIRIPSTICSVSTSFATCPKAFTPRLR